ncbi:hypothetical protein GS449_14020 [Rhodococcus hoagii]|nr:hypothetical protein [Prescottella equi]
MGFVDRARPHTRRSRSAATLTAGAIALAAVFANMVAQPATADTLTGEVYLGYPYSPSAVAVSPDGTRAYVTSVGGNRLTGTMLSVIDTATGTVTSTVEPAQQGGPQIAAFTSVAVSPDGTRAYVGNYPQRAVSVIDTTANPPAVIGAPISVPRYPNAVAVSPDGTRAYVTSGDADGTVSVIDTAQGVVVASIPVGTNPNTVAISPDGTRVYVANSGGGQRVSVIDTTAIPPAVIANVGVGVGPTGVTVSPDGSRAYVTNYYDGTMSVIDAAAAPPVVIGAPIPVGTNPGKAAITPDGTRVYVANAGGQNTVSVIDTATTPPALIATVPVGTNPNDVAISPDGVHAYVTNGGNGGSATVSVIRIGDAPTISGTPASGTVGRPYSYAFTVAGRPAPTVSVTTGALPDGLTLTSNGLLAGTPTSAGLFEFTLTASNGIDNDVHLRSPSASPLPQTKIRLRRLPVHSAQPEASLPDRIGHHHRRFPWPPAMLEWAATGLQGAS